MPSIEVKIWLALKSRVETLPFDYVVNWPMEPFEKPVSDGRPVPYIECRHLPNANVRWFIGSHGPMERMGILQVTLCWPASDIGNTHPDVLIQTAGQVAAQFPTDLKMRFEGVTVRVERAPDVAQPYRDEAYWRVPVSVRYSCFA